MTSATVAGTTSTYLFDGDGKRIRQTVGGVTTPAVYDVNAGLPVLLDDGSRKYVWGTRGLAYTVEVPSGAITVYHADGLGSVRALTDSTGTVVQTYGTDEFGVPDAGQTQGTATQPLQYTGEPRDSTGLVYLRARMYDPGSGRFVQADPLRKSGPGVGGWNRYAYVGNNPCTQIDPSGLRPDVASEPGGICVTAVIAGAAGVYALALVDVGLVAATGAVAIATIASGPIGVFLLPADAALLLADAGAFYLTFQFAAMTAQGASLPCAEVKPVRIGIGIL